MFGYHYSISEALFRFGEGIVYRFSNSAGSEIAWCCPSFYTLAAWSNLIYPIALGAALLGAYAFFTLTLAYCVAPRKCPE
ncbi:MAG: hypothetical protein EA368_18045 [Leptolyngbya sp. DLM2.Bin27]|nr:MAG: hypothetical protein EA368_18045 [Leptolyngbya sp. DLM2.Bin27]